MDMKKFLERLRRELIADGFERRQDSTMKDSSPSWTEYESTYAETELEPPESMMETEMSDGCRMVRRPFERAVEGRKKWRTSHFGPPGVLRAVSDDRTSGEAAAESD